MLLIFLLVVDLIMFASAGVALCTNYSNISWILCPLKQVTNLVDQGIGTLLEKIHSMSLGFGFASGYRQKNINQGRMDKLKHLLHDQLLTIILKQASCSKYAPEFIISGFPSSNTRK